MTLTRTLLATDLRPRYVIGVDPGSSTGVVTWDNQERRVISQVTEGPRTTVTMLNSALQEMVLSGTRPVLLIERLDLSQDTLRKTRAGIDDLVHVLGATWAMASFFGLDYHELGRSDSKNFAHDDALKRRGLWLETRHTRDALRVIITHLVSADAEFAKYWASTP